MERVPQDEDIPEGDEQMKEAQKLRGVDWSRVTDTTAVVRHEGVSILFRISTDGRITTERVDNEPDTAPLVQTQIARLQSVALQAMRTPDATRAKLFTRATPEQGAEGFARVREAIRNASRKERK